MIFLFGYVRPRKSELLVRELEEYNGIYCTLCRNLGKKYGLTARLALNYDCTFYALVLISAKSKPFPRFQKGRCVTNPFKQCAFCSEEDQEFHQASALTVILVYHKLMDDIRDSKAMKKYLRVLALPVVRHAYRRAAADYPHLGEIVAEAMKEQSEIEKNQSPGLDSCAEPTAHMMERIMELSSGEAPMSPRSRILNRFGYFLGRWIYFIDAADDLEDDIRTGSFNPLASRFHLNGESGKEELRDAKIYANDVLNQTLSQLGGALNLMEMNSMGPIVRNVVILGLPQIQKELLFKKEKTNV
ncbi:hypothetical protein EQM14_07620 [Caproiciproducens sp. NJN-50]|uniref:DUF5685 family protein n=1 Tax=Acutalibacteraceae TaxID=3082771 RepID=UPI000FFE1B1E|nr:MULTISPECIES: DUF5685 family protein [Acutalibacteraceae]QAT49651.1 hypothetical protein EQM14_07620 [Caproiciproducens sp. NJN-50]